jgi:hypothetical protein
LPTIAEGPSRLLIFVLFLFFVILVPHLLTRATFLVSQPTRLVLTTFQRELIPLNAIQEPIEIGRLEAMAVQV